MSRIILILSAALLLTACEKKKEDEVKTCVAGTGGTITLNAYPRHHGVAVKPYHLWIRFNTKEFPGAAAALYDLSINADSAMAYVTVPNLKCGDYYLYMSGYDDKIQDDVLGGIPYTIPTNATGTLSVDVPVTE